MANFFLIDQSLQELGGHHHDYVRCIASAAQQADFLTTIGTNQKFHDSMALQSLGQLKKVFRDTTYQPDSYLSGLKHLTRNHCDYLAGFRSVSRPSISRIWNLFRNYRHKLRRKRNIRNFAVDCERFFQQTLFTENDHAFFTTVNEMEFMGLAAYLANHPRTLQVNWHLQFHFNLFDGRTPEYKEQADVALAIQNCFDAALSRIPYHRLNFYTTSETLADQFNSLGVGDFQVLAYPVRPELFDEDDSIESVTGFEQERPIRITCPGEVRREKKAIEYLQPLVDQIWENHIQNGGVQIVVQRPHRKWPAREKIELKPPVEWRDVDLELGHDWVEYFSHPLSDIEYLRLLRETDVGLLFYDSRAYFSRRAGVLGELLSCGKPVIVPAGSWLGNQIAEPNFRYIDSLCNARNGCRTLELEELSWSQRNVPLPGGVLSFDEQAHPFELSFELADSENAFVIEFDWHWPVSQGVYCRFQIEDGAEQIIGHRTNGMSPVGLFQTDQRHVTLRMSNAFHNSTASIKQFSVHALSVPDETPSGSVGVIAASVDDIPCAVDEIVAHFDHYRKTSRMFSQTWCQQHEPMQTLSSLVSSSSSAGRAA
ncbi:MAG: hypothetical protein AAGA30_06230 [Planctomycetota bacterium]